MKASLPLLLRGAILMERVQNVERHQWVGWHGAKKKRFYCVSLMVFSEWKWVMGKWAMFREKKLNHQAPQAKQCPWGGRRRHLCQLPHNRMTMRTQRMDVCICVVTVSLHHRHTPFSCSKYKKGSLVSVNEMMLNRPQGALAARFSSKPQAKTVDNGRGKKKKRKDRNTPG